MSRVGLVLGGGGITGTAFQIATLMSLELACEWDPNEAEVVVGTSGGAYVASLLRSGQLGLDCFVREGEDSTSVARRIREHVFVSQPGMNVGRWLKGGLLPGLRRPGVKMLMGSPARYRSDGMVGWVREQIGDEADGWPHATTLLTAYELDRRQRVVFGAQGASEVALADAVAASSAIPVLFHPHQIAGRSYVDGGVVSGTHLDLVLDGEALDLVIVVAPMAPLERRPRAWAHELVLDRIGRRSLDEELKVVNERWPGADVVVLRPPHSVMAHMRPNPMAADRAVPTFVSALHGMRDRLAEPEVWQVLSRHLVTPRSIAV